LKENFSKQFKEFVALCLNKDPEERPTAKELLKHRFIKTAKKTSMLVELIERRQRWLQVVGEQDSEDESENDGNDDEKEDADQWIFDTIKEKSAPKQPEDLEKKSVLNAAKSEDRTKNRSSSTPEAPKSKEIAPPVSQKNGATPAVVAPTAPAATVEKPKDNGAANSNPPSGSGSVSSNSRPSALTSVIYPVLSKLLKSNQEEGVIAALAQLKIAFDNAERAKPGITHQLIAQIIETLKR